MANKLLAEFPDKLKEVKMHIKEEKEETPAQFQEYCAQIAIEEHWRREDKNDCKCKDVTYSINKRDHYDS